MKKPEVIESIILLIIVILFLPVWLAQSGKVEFSPTIASFLRFLQYPLLIVLCTILVRRLRRIIHAVRENKNRPGGF
ncbi:hypothetical protein JT359_15255 [Candidatus Poribacteria bacterium]|nr:hypothetical protein [Candidatus Poribacteria bacterium]